MATRYRYWLQMLMDEQTPSEEGVQIKPGGSTLGRAQDCDIIFPEDETDIHHYHATLRPRFDGLRVYRDDQNPVLVNGKPIDERAELKAGDHIRIGRFSFQVGAAPYRAVGPVWLLKGVGANLLPIAPSLTIGDGDDDTARISGWPAGALELFEAEGRIILDTRMQRPSVDGRVLETETQEPLVSGAHVSLLGHEIQLLASTGGTGKTTVVEGKDPIITSLHLTWQPAGATLVVGYDVGKQIPCWLAEKRAELMATLMLPPPPYTEADLIPDDVLIAILWPGDPGKTRVDLNGLIYHTRRALLKKGIDGKTVILKHSGGTKLEVRVGTPRTVI